MELMVLGVNYKTAPIEVRERLTYNIREGTKVCLELTSNGVVSEAVLISTCNRTELYVKAQDFGASHILKALFIEVLAGEQLKNEVQTKKQKPSLVSLEPYIYIEKDEMAVLHLMRVASGLDSMVLGEAEILGQVKKSYTAASNAGTVGKYLGRWFQSAFAVAKEVRTRTEIGFNPVSVAYAAARLSQHIFSDLSKMVVLLIGAGELIQLAAKHLMSLGVRRIMVANRTYANAEKIADEFMQFDPEFETEALRLDQISEKLHLMDMVITATHSPVPILHKTQVLEAILKRKRRPVLMIDLSVPRDIDPTIGDCEDIYLYCIDDLQNIVEENRKARGQAVILAENIIKEAAEQFMNWCKAQAFLTTLKVFRNKYEAMRDAMLEESLQQLRLGEAPEAVVQKLSHRLTNQFLHTPTRRLRKAGFGREEDLLAMAMDLFQLH